MCSVNFAGPMNLGEVTNMNEEVVEFITKYLKYFVLFEPDAPQLREKIKSDFLKLPNIREVIFNGIESLEYIKVIDNNENIATWTFTTTGEKE